ncbi:DUF6074 family protein [Pararhizobium haloflavum]|uniref:DUF6074 family protein n=1 Tax=Pararhizobium haloflavum TaxID=2037914 RepID=UPI00130004BC|nr:DUF6074 family protein [Pararhizobium haloflavum]
MSNLNAVADASGQVVVFPLHRRSGAVRVAAAKLLRSRTAAAANRYRHTLAQEKFAELAALGLSEDEQDEAVGAFLTEVEREMAELHYERIRLHV